MMDKLAVAIKGIIGSMFEWSMLLIELSGSSHANANVLLHSRVACKFFMV